MKKQLLLMKGMLLGAVADKKLNTAELLFLDLWLKKIGEKNLKGDFLDLSEQIHDVLEDGVFAQEEHEDTLTLIDDILKYSEVDSDEHALTVLGCICAICSDGTINHTELEQLNQLIDKHIDIPLCKLLKLKLQYSSPENELLEFLNGITGNNFLNTGSISSNAINFMFDEFDGEEIEGKKVAITGETIHFSRDEIKQAIMGSGAVVIGSVSSKTDILIVGEKGSNDYTFGSFGRKFERAIDEKMKGIELKIYSVQDIIPSLIEGLKAFSNLAIKPNEQTTLEEVLLACLQSSTQNQIKMTSSTPNTFTIAVSTADKVRSELTIKQLQYDNKKYSLKTENVDIVTTDKTKAYTALLTSMN